MATLTDQIQSLLQGGGAEQLSSRLGIDSGTLATVAQTALPAIIGALSHNTREPQGAESLSTALRNDHDGSILDNLGGLLGGAGNGAGILGHLFGARREAVEEEVGRSTGIDAATVGKVLVTLAPLVMGWLGKQQRAQNLDAQGVGQVVQQEHAELQKQDTGGLLGRFSSLLDSNNDGSVMDDVARIGGSLLGRTK